MKKSIALLVCLLSIGMTHAEKLSDRYTVRPVQDGLLYFIKPYEIPSQERKIDAASMDITYLVTWDSVTLNMSIYLPEVIGADSIVFTSEQSMTLTKFETFFIDSEKKKFVHRYSCRIPYTYIRSLYNNEKPYRMTIYSKGQSFAYGFPAKSWDKERKTMGQLFMLIDRNKLL